MKLHDELVGLVIFFCVLDTIAVGLRIFVRTTLTKGAFGWDDVALVITYVGMVLLSGLTMAAMHYGYASYDDKPWYNVEKATRYNVALNDICYIISGTVKVSVALVLYRLDTRRFIRITLIADIIICCIWTTVATLVLGLGCADTRAYTFSSTVCRNTNYSQEAFYVIFDFFHVLLPIVILWNVQISKAQKWSIVCLFGVGLLAAIAAIMKLQVYVEAYHPTATTDPVVIWYRAVTWALVEHGLSLFASSILALRPLTRYISRGWETLASTLYGSSSSSNSRPSVRGTQSLLSEPPGSAEMHTIGVRNDVSVYSEHNVAGHLKHPLYVAEAYNESLESQKEFGNGRKGHIKGKDDLV